MKPIITTINEARAKGQPLTTLHFDNGAAAMLFYCEMSGQISDGKYENSKPQSHWLWVTNVAYVIDGEEYYEGSRTGKIRYDLSEWPGYIKDADRSEEGDKEWGWARRVLDYGRIAMTLGDQKIEEILNNSKEYPFVGDAVKIVTERWGDTLRENPNATLDDVDSKYIESYIAKSGIWNKSTFNKFKKTEYTLRDLKADLSSMETTINTKY